MSIRLIATDLDGTLLNTQLTISDHTADVLCRADRMGYYVVPSTGRSLYALPSDLDRFPHDYQVINSGATVIERSTGRYIYSAPISHHTLSRFFRLIADYDIACNLATANGPYMPRPQWEAFMVELLTVRHSSPFWLDFYRHKVKTFDDYEAWLTQTNPTVFKINLYFRDKATNSEVHSRLLKDFPDLYVCHSPGGDLEITDIHATKGLALIALGEHLGLTAEQMIAFGDTDNDIDMLKTVGIGVAMANARPEALAVADRVTRSNDEDGVAWAIEQWVLSQSDEV